MKKAIRYFAFLLCIVTITVFLSVSAPVTANEPVAYISATLQRNPALFADNSSTVIFSNTLDIAILSDRSAAIIEFTYCGTEYHGTLTGSCNSVNTSIEGFFGVYSGVLASQDEAVEIDVDVSATFTSTEIYAIISVGCLSDAGMPDLALYGEFTDTLSQLSAAISARSNNSDTQENTSIPQSVRDEPITAGSLEPQSTIVDVGMVRRGQYDSKVNGYNLFSIVIDCPKNLINGNDMFVYGSVYTTIDSFLEYLREVEDYDSYTLKGYALSAYPYSVECEIGGYHQDFILIQQSCTPQPNSDTITVPVITYINPSTYSFNYITVPFELASTTLTAKKYVNTPSTIPWNQIARWEIQDGRWDEDSFSFDSSSTGLSMGAVLKYSGSISQSVFRTVNVTANVAYFVTLGHNYGPCSYVISAKECSVSPIVTVYPATVG